MFRIFIDDVCGDKTIHFAHVEHQMLAMFNSFCAYYGKTAIIVVLNEENKIILKNA